MRSGDEGKLSVRLHTEEDWKVQNKENNVCGPVF